jgi:hypothetical protein
VQVANGFTMVSLFMTMLEAVAGVQVVEEMVGEPDMEGAMTVGVEEVEEVVVEEAEEAAEEEEEVEEVEEEAVKEEVVTMQDL